MIDMFYHINFLKQHTKLLDNWWIRAKPNATYTDSVNVFIKKSVK